MKEDLFAKRPASHPRLALRPKEAAESLGISERLLWESPSSSPSTSQRVPR
jgi:hypothetical protein